MPVLLHRYLLARQYAKSAARDARRLNEEEVPSLTMQRASEQSAAIARLMAGKERERRKAEGQVEAVPDEVWEGKVGEVLRALSKARVRKVFEEFDTNDSGCLDADEFTKGMHQLGLSLLPSDVGLRIFMKHDASGDGTLEIDELIARCSPHLTLPH